MNRTENGLWTIGFGALGTTLKALEDQGVTHEQLKQLRSNTYLAARVAAVLNGTETKLSVAPHDAKAVGEFFRISYSEEQLASFGRPPAPFEGHITFFDPGFSILQLREAMKDKGRLFFPQGWYNNEPFAMLNEQPHYRQLRTEAVKDSFWKTFGEQKALLSPEEEVPTARMVVMGVILHFLATGERLLDHFVRCSDLSSDGHRVIVGDFDVSGLGVDGGYHDDSRHNYVGLASVRKL